MEKLETFKSILAKRNFAKYKNGAKPDTVREWDETLHYLAVELMSEIKDFSEVEPSMIIRLQAYATGEIIFNKYGKKMYFKFGGGYK